MSFLAGLWYFDRRPLAEQETARILAGTPLSFRGPGLILAHDSIAPFRRRGSAIVFDGRLDNREDLLARFGDALDDQDGDAALAFAVYEKSGLDGFGHLIGDWSLILWDAGRRAMVLASDFAGVRPLYYSAKQDVLECATSLQALIDFDGSGAIDESYAGGMLTAAGSPNRTPYRSIQSVPPGGAVITANGSVKIETFWRPPIDRTIRYTSESEYEENLRSIFAGAVRCRIPEGGTALAELSGGLDSSSIVCAAKKLKDSGGLKNSRLVTFSVEHEGSIDTKFYTAVEELCGFESVHVPAAGFPFCSEDSTGGAVPVFWERMHVNNAIVARRFGATTHITGQLGDLVMGNWWDDSVQVAWPLRHLRAGDAFKQSLAWSQALRKPIWGILWRGLLANLPMPLAPESLWGQDTSNVRLNMEDSMTAEFRTRVAGVPPAFSRTWMEAAPERRKRLRQLTEALELRTLQPPEAIQHLSYTHPFAHRPLVEFMLSITPEIVCGPGQPRRLMRSALGDQWPPALRRRQSKDSFGGVYLDSLRPMARAMLARGSRLQVVERGYVDLTSLRKRLEALANSLECNEPQLRNIILLEFWLANRDSRRNQPKAIPA